MHFSIRPEDLPLASQPCAPPACSTDSSSWCRRQRGRLASAFGPTTSRAEQHATAKSLIEASIVTNAALAAYTVQQELHGLGPGDLRAAYGVYLLESREVWTPPGNAGATVGLAEPPRDSASFLELGEAIATADRIASLITSA